MAATLEYSPGTKVAVYVTFLTPDLLERMDATEGAYFLCELFDIHLHLGISLHDFGCALILCHMANHGAQENVPGNSLGKIS